MTVPPVEEQLAHLQLPVDKLWWLAQMERGIEASDLDREPRFGSKKVLQKIAKEKEPITKKEMFDMQWEVAALGLHEGELYDTPVKQIDVTITVGDVDD